MIDIDEALSLIAQTCRPLPARSRSLVNALGCVLAEDVTADVDSPPHDKALVDGFAIRMEDAGRELSVLEQVMAGEVPTRILQPGTTSQIMTGAPIAEGTEAMVMVEDVTCVDNLASMPAQVNPGQHIMRRASVFAKGDVVLGKGHILRPLEVGLLCEVGRTKVSCHLPPSLAVLPTGDELVHCGETPAAGQIRNSNGPMLHACATTANCSVDLLEVGRDAQPQLTSQIEKGLEKDVLILSGGVSAGVKDLVPQVLSSLGVKKVFHKVKLKPGKPVWFGVRDHGDRPTYVFGLPGNPISSFVCFELFVKAAIRAISGNAQSPDPLPGRLATEFQQRGNRPTYFPATSRLQHGRYVIRPLQDWRGSADMKTLAQANCLVYFDAGSRLFRAGEKCLAIPLR